MSGHIPKLESENGKEGGEEGFRSFARYALNLPVRILSGTEEFHAITENISANGVLFRLEKCLPVDTPIEFLMEIPEKALGNGCAAAAHCAGRIVRSYEEGRNYFAAAIIEEYRFQ